jgi:hypothetical protein
MRRLVYARVALAAGCALLVARPSSAEVQVAVHPDRVDINARSAPLSEVLDRLAKQTQMQVTYEGAPPRTLVTAAVQSPTPAQALLSVLEGLGVNYALQLDPTGREVKSILVLAEKGTGASAGAAGGPAHTRQRAPFEPAAARVPPPPPPPDEDEDPMADDDEPPMEMRPDRPGRMRPGRPQPERPGGFEPAPPSQAPTIPGPTQAYPVSPFAPTAPAVVPGIQQPVFTPAPIQQAPPDNDPDS